MAKFEKKSWIPTDLVNRYLLKTYGFVHLTFKLKKKSHEDERMASKALLFNVEIMDVEVQNFPSQFEMSS